MTHDDTELRLEALKWMNQALSDLDRAIEIGETATAQQLLQRLKDVLDALAGPPDAIATH